MAITNNCADELGREIADFAMERAAGTGVPDPANEALTGCCNAIMNIVTAEVGEEFAPREVIVGMRSYISWVEGQVAREAA